MTTNQGRGGYRKPANPAPVSNPQSGRRTDGGAGDPQPMRVASGGAYGERKAAEEQQRGAPMAGSGSGAPVQGGAPGPTGAPPPDMFRPSEVPGQSIGGAPALGGPADMMREDPRMLLRELYKKFPTPAIAALLKHSGANG